MLIGSNSNRFKIFFSQNVHCFVHEWCQLDDIRSCGDFAIFILYCIIRQHMWPSTGKPGTTRHPLKIFFLHLQSCRRPDIELSKFYRRSLSRSHYNRPNRFLPSAWNNTFLRNRSIFSWYLRTPRCAQFSCRRSHE